MAKKDWKKQDKQKFNGFVYILKIEIGAETIFKPGTTNRTPIRRMLEIAEEMNRALGYIPKMMLIRGKQTKDNYKVEAELLKQTEQYRYTLSCVNEVTGESELRKMNEQDLLNQYDHCIAINYPADIEFKVEL